MYSALTAMSDNQRESIFDVVVKEIMEQREEILRAIVAKYNIDDPARLEQIIYHDIDGSLRWSVVVKNPSPTTLEDKAL